MVSDPRPGWSPGPATSRPVDELDFAMTWRKISGHNQLRPIDLVKLCRANFGRLIFNWQVWSVSGSGRPVDFGEFLPAARTISCGPPFELHHGQAFFIIENQRLIVVTPENRNHPPSVIQKPSPISYKNPLLSRPANVRVSIARASERLMPNWKSRKPVIPPALPTLGETPIVLVWFREVDGRGPDTPGDGWPRGDERSNSF